MTEGETIRSEISELLCDRIEANIHVSMSDEEIQAAVDAVQRRHSDYPAEAFDQAVQDAMEHLADDLERRAAEHFTHAKELERYTLERMAGLPDHPEGR
jgi:hypothetical protein